MHSDDIHLDWSIGKSLKTQHIFLYVIFVDICWLCLLREIVIKTMEIQVSFNALMEKKNHWVGHITIIYIIPKQMFIFYFLFNYYIPICYLPIVPDFGNNV